MKVLTGNEYDEARLYGIMAEMFFARVGRLAKENDVSITLTGVIIKNINTEEVGYIINEESEYFSLLPQIHKDRIIDVVPDDGWLSNEGE